MSKIILMSFVSLLLVSGESFAMEQDEQAKSFSKIESAPDSEDSEDADSYVPQVKSSRRCRGDKKVNKGQRSPAQEKKEILHPEDIAKILKNKKFSEK